MLIYLPAGGPPAVLTSVLALELNVDFNNAGFLNGTSSIPFENLALTNFSTLPNLNGLSVSQFLADANTCLGGGSCLFSFSTMDTIANDLNGAFDLGTPDSFAQTNLALPGSVVPTPEPSSLLLVATGLLGLGWTRRLKRAR